MWGCIPFSQIWNCGIGIAKVDVDRINFFESMEFHSLVSGMQASNGNCQILGQLDRIFSSFNKKKMSSMLLAALCQDIPMDDTPEQLFHANQSRETFLLKLESQNRKTLLTYMTFSMQIYPAFYKAVIMPSR